MRVCILLISLLSAAALQAQSLAQWRWKDQALKTCVMDLAAKKGWLQIEQVTALKCHGKGIKNADELAQFTALTSLSLYNNELRELDVTALRSLTYLNLANNKLQSLKIAGLSQLDTLFLFRNRLNTVDLTGLSAVTKVRLMQNRLTQLDITPLVSLETGYFFDNELEDLQITGLNKLTFLDVKQNPMPDELYDFYDEQEGIVISHDGNADDWQ